jgi:anti-anti-sigma factor
MWGTLEVERQETDAAGRVQYHLSGALSYGEPGNRFVAALKKDLEAGARVLVIDVSRLERIDSGGIGLLAAALASAHNANAQIRLTGLNERYHKLFRVVGLTNVFGVEDETAEEDSAS